MLFNRTFYHYLKDWGSIYGTEDPWKVGETRTLPEGDLIMCGYGYHASPRPRDPLALLTSVQTKQLVLTEVRMGRFGLKRAEHEAVPKVAGRSRMLVRAVNGHSVLMEATRRRVVDLALELAQKADRASLESAASEFAEPMGRGLMGVDDLAFDRAGMKTPEALSRLAHELDLIRMRESHPVFPPLLYVFTVTELWQVLDALSVGHDDGSASMFDRTAKEALADPGQQITGPLDPSRQVWLS